MIRLLGLVLIGLGTVGAWTGRLPVGAVAVVCLLGALLLFFGGPRNPGGPRATRS